MVLQCLYSRAPVWSQAAPRNAPLPKARNYTGSKLRGGSVNPRLPKELRRQPSAAEADLRQARPDEARLFREAVRDVKPLGRPAPAGDHPSSRPRRPRPAARFSRADRLAVLEE